ncbi:MAG: hypothetical protein ACMVP2_03820 [Imperialibacter sp.]|uniref:hypothetical protein n=1 Tax=Imperialibacter sp. TaxID=2038411 RepID=UPI003A869A61
MTYTTSDQLTHDEVECLERQLKSEDITPGHLIGIGTGIYPNTNNFELQTPKTYRLKENKNLILETQYFMDTSNIVRVILYQWDNTRNPNFLTDKQKNKKYLLFQEKFNQLARRVTTEFGKPTEKAIESTNNPENFRDGIKWLYGNNNAYLFMFGNNSNGYRQIRLAIYGE